MHAPEDDVMLTGLAVADVDSQYFLVLFASFVQFCSLCRCECQFRVKDHDHEAEEGSSSRWNEEIVLFDCNLLGYKCSLEAGFRRCRSVLSKEGTEQEGARL